MPDFVHKPVMVAEVLAALKPKPAGRYADGTLGGGGHAAAMLAASSPTGWLSGCDRDGVAVEATNKRLAEFAGRFEIRRGNFSELAGWVPREVQYPRGYGHLYARHVTQADKGCDFDFLEGTAPTPEPEIH